MPWKRLFAAAALCLASPALAHGDEVSPDASWLSLWHFSPEILIGLLFAGAIYRRGSRGGAVKEAWRSVAFYAGLVALFVALISPVERLADHVFAIHQVEHMLLRTIAPMLLFLSRPQAAMVRGLPRGVSKFFAGRGWLQRVIDVLRLPPVATGLFLLASYFWMYPRWHDLAILDEPVHYLWHVSLLVTGLIFFSVVFDRRAPPQGAGLGARLAMVVIAALGNIVLGAFLSFKTSAIYSAYLHLGHMWHVSMLSDEQVGGLIMWIPGTMMFAVSALLILFRFGQEETRNVDRRMRTGRSAAQPVRRSNGAVAFGLALFALLMLALAVSVVSLIDHQHGAKRDFGMAGQIPG